MATTPSAAETPPAANELAQLRHDLYTPLNQIIGYSELLEEEAAEDQPVCVADLRKIQQAAAQLHSLIRTRLALAPSEPIAATDHSSDPPAGPETNDEGLAPAHPQRLGHLLVVDDDPLNRDMLTSRLHRQGHQVSTASDGLEALEQVRQQRFDLVLLDMLMPNLDGYGTLSRLKADEELRHLPVIMISALDDLANVVRCIEIGAEDYLPKPFNATLLRARIGACLEKKALRDQELELFRNLSLSQQRLDRELKKASTCVASLSDGLREDPRVMPLLAAFERMTSAVARRETELRATIKELEIQINASALQHQVGSIVADPAFQSLAERARAMRQRRANQTAA